MTRNLWTVLILSLLIFALLSVAAFGMHQSKRDRGPKITPASSLPTYKLAGAESNTGYIPTGNAGGSTPLGFEDVKVSGVGLTVGYTQYDYQSNGRMNRQVDWRGTEMVHFTWMKQLTDIEGEDRGTGYEAWDADAGEFIFVGVGGGCDIHPRLGTGINYSGYVGLDVGTTGKVNISNHHDEGDGYSSTLWYDFSAGGCFFSPYKSRVPDSFYAYPDLEHTGDPEYIWPNHEYHVWDGDTVTHLIAQQGNTQGSSGIAYFRRAGSDTLGAWSYPPMMVDTVDDLGEIVTASRVSGKVCLVWIANLPATTGDGESVTRGSQRENDIYWMTSLNMGASWGAKMNITKSDSTTVGWRAHCDLSALIGTDDNLHVIWDAFPWTPVGGGSFTDWPTAGRLFHWDEGTDAMRVVKDFSNWAPPEEGTWCYGGAWNEMAIVKMQLSECDGKYYAVFVQFNDFAAGVYDDCHQDATNFGSVSGSANGELYISVSDNGGFNWDIARNLTDTYTPFCDTIAPALLCESDNWPAVSRFGMQVVDGDFVDAIVVDPSGGEDVTDYYLDVLYVNDKHPGGAVQDKGIWTYNPLKWFRVPCVEPVPNPVLSISPASIADPTWTKPGVQLDTTIKLENVGNAELHITDISVNYISGGSGWIGLGNTGPIDISHLTPNFYDLAVNLNVGGAISAGPVGVEAELIIDSDAAGKSLFNYPIYLIVADTVQIPEQAEVRTECFRIIFNNAGNIGDGGGYPVGQYNMNFFDDCDTTDNVAGQDDNASVYLYDASPFVLRINDSNDTTLNSYMFDADWLSRDGMRPLEGIFVDSTTYPDYQYGYTGKFLTKDSAVAIEVEYFAPTGLENCEFVVLKQRFYNNTEFDINGVYIGDLMDWDIPSDSSVDNGSGFDRGTGTTSLDLMYCYGAEYDADSIENNDCVLADSRVGGMAFYNGFRAPWYLDKPIVEGVDSLENPAGPWWTHMNPDWVGPTGGFVPEQLYDKITTMGGAWESWQATTPDSVYEDLNMVAVFGQWDLKTTDTLVFVKILATEYDGGISGLEATINTARDWIAARADIFSWPERVESPGCCDVAGDANHNGAVNILDVTFNINYLYKGQAAPFCNDEADANGNGAVNILDVTHVINYLYKGGLPPVCGETGTK